MKEENEGGALQSIPAHKLDPDDTSHLSDRRRMRSLETSMNEVRIGGMPEREAN